MKNKINENNFTKLNASEMKGVVGGTEDNIIIIIVNGKMIVIHV